jgi:serine/threonine protein kinase
MSLLQLRGTFAIGLDYSVNHESSSATYNAYIVGSNDKGSQLERSLFQTLRGVSYFRIRDPRTAVGDHIRSALIHNMIQSVLSIGLRLASSPHEGISQLWVVNLSRKNGGTSRAIASLYFKNGNILQFLDTLEDSGLNRIRMVKEIAAAILHLHTIGIIHGNLQPDNILITDEGHVLVVDVGINALERQFLRALTNHTSLHSAWVYKAPEDNCPLNDAAAPAPTMAMDIYAFASVVFAVRVFCQTHYWHSLTPRIDIRRAPR